MGLSGVATFFIVIVILAIAAFGGWIVFTHLRARRLGLPTPTLSSYNPFGSRDTSYGAPQPAAGGVMGWVNDKIRGFRNRGNRTATGGYEEPLGSFGGAAGSGRPGRRGFGPLDPDDAWDSRVGNEADVYGPGGYYEEAELGLHGDTGYAGNVHAGSAAGPAGVDDRGRARSREPDAYIGGSKQGLDRRYDEETGGSSGGRAANPFDDDAAVSMRGVSPRPIETSGPGMKKHKKGGSLEDSPNERRSMFRENM